MSNSIQNAEGYLSDLCLNLNLRLLCDMEPASNGLSQRILWVEKITMQEEELSVCEKEEKSCQEERILKERKESVLSEQIKYIAKKVKNHFTTFWKRKEGS